MATVPKNFSATNTSPTYWLSEGAASGAYVEVIAAYSGLVGQQHIEALEDAIEEAELLAEIKLLTPSHAEFARMAERYPPPQSIYEEDY